MSDAEWDADDFEPSVPAGGPKATDKWDGEDSDDEIKDNWDDEEEEEKKDENQVIQVPKKKSLKEKIAEKEAKRKAAIEERKKQEEEAQKAMTPEELAAEKLRQQKLQEESDLQLAKEAFGVSEETNVGVIDAFNPTTKEDFDQFETLLKNKILKYEKSPFYFTLMDSLIRDIVINLEAEEIKKLGSALTALSNEKSKQQKAAKGKKKKTAAKLNAGRDNNYEDYTVGGYDEFDDFM